MAARVLFNSTKTNQPSLIRWPVAFWQLRAVLRGCVICMILINWHDTYSLPGRQRHCPRTGTSADYLWPSLCITLCPFRVFSFVAVHSWPRNTTRTGGGGWGLVAPNRNKIPAALRRQSEPIYRIFFVSFDNPRTVWRKVRGRCHGRMAPRKVWSNGFNVC